MDRLSPTKSQAGMWKGLVLNRPKSFLWGIFAGILCFCNCTSKVPKPIQKTTIKQEARIDSLIDLAWEQLNSDLQLYKKYGLVALNESISENYLKGRGDANHILGTYHYYSGQLDSALHLFQFALLDRIELGDSAKISGTLNNIGLAYQRKGDYFQCIKEYEEALRWVPSSESQKRVRLLDNIGSVYNDIGNYSEALKYNNTADSLFRILTPQSVSHGICLLNRGNIFESMSALDRALSAYHEAEAIFQRSNSPFNLGQVKNNIGNAYLKKGEIDIAIEFYQVASSIYESDNNLVQLAGVEQNLGSAYQAKGNQSLALSFLRRSLVKWDTLDNQQKQAEVLINQGWLYLTMRQSQNARKVFLEAQAIHPVNLQLRTKLFQGLFSTYGQLGQYKTAFPFQQEYNTLIDSLELERIHWQKLNADYVDQKNQILLLEKDKAIALEKNKKERILNLALLIGLILSLAILLVAYLNWEGKKKRYKTEKKALKRQQQVERLLKDQELISIRNVLEIQDRERRRIAQDLHDRLGSILSMVKLHFQRTNKDIELIKVSNQEAYDKANSLLDEACTKVREIAHDLNSGVLKNFGLIAAIEDLKNTLINTGEYEVELVTHQLEERLPQNYEATLFRIVQELISNILRHAQASEISIQLLRKGQQLHMSIEDNGQGMDVKKLEEVTGMGIKSIRSRLLPLDGKLTIDSHPGRGTTIFIELPIKTTT